MRRTNHRQLNLQLRLLKKSRVIILLRLDKNSCLLIPIQSTNKENAKMDNSFVFVYKQDILSIYVLSPLGVGVKILLT